MRIAVEGCCHGQLDAIYHEIARRERQYNYKVDLLLICGDFHSIRNEADLDAIACPRKYLHLGTFHKYYSGELKVPVPTVFIGGNHESSNYLWELYHGGWVCPDIYFLGWGGVINVGGMRIGGMSGIYKRHHYETGHYEVTPFNETHKRSIYHVRKYDIHKMLQVKEPMDVFLSHDWPLGIERYGNIEWLLRIKPFFTKEVNTNTLGSAPYGEVLSSLKPAHWFSAHLHVRYTATVHWNTQGQRADGLQPQQQSVSQPQARASESVTAEVIKNPDEIEIDLDDEENVDSGTKAISSEPAKNPDEINIDLDDEDEPEAKAEVITTPAVNPEEIQIEMDDEENEDPAPQQKQTQVHQESANTPAKPYPTCTKFLALDKCHGGRKYLEIIDLPEFTGPIEFKYDEEWLAIVRTLDPYLSLEYNQRKSLEGDELAHALKVNREWVRNNVTNTRGLAIPLNFQQTTPAHDPVRTMGPKEKRDFNMPHLNPQTAEFAAMLQIQNKINEYGRRVNSV